MTQSNPIEMKTVQVRGRDLKLGDRVVLDIGLNDEIRSIEPYAGLLQVDGKALFPDGAIVVRTAYCRCGLTVDNNELVEVVR